MVFEVDEELQARYEELLTRLRRIASAILTHQRYGHRAFVLSLSSAALRVNQQLINVQRELTFSTPRGKAWQ